MRINVDIVKPAEDGIQMHYYEIACNSSEVASLPTVGVYDGSQAMATDNMSVYIFNEASSTWKMI